jgi:hypothetical protein
MDLHWQRIFRGVLYNPGGLRENDSEYGQALKNPESSLPPQPRNHSFRNSIERLNSNFNIDRSSSNRLEIGQ